MWAHLREAGTVVLKGRYSQGHTSWVQIPILPLVSFVILSITSLYLSFFSCKMGTIMVPVSRDVKMKWINMCKVLRTMWGT